MMKSIIKVLVVDDAEFLRKNIPLILESNPEIKVIGTAATGHEGIKMAKRLQPDVITMDVVMPQMSGIEALKVIMKEIPTPVVMISSKTYEGASETMEALTLGAVDYMVKPSGQVSLDIAKIRNEMINKVLLASTARVKSIAGKDASPGQFAKLAEKLKGSMGENAPAKKELGKEKISKIPKIIGIAASTGGPMALQNLLAALPESYPVPICIVQHIGEEYIPHMLERFNNISKLHVKAATDGEPLKPGRVYFSPDKKHLTVEVKNNAPTARLKSEPLNALFRPSGNELFWSLGSHMGKGEVWGIILTGMGDDGAQGLKRIRESGGHTIAQDEATCVVFGMPKQAIDAGGVEKVLPLEGIAARMMTLAH